MAQNVGIKAIQVYFPRNYVSAVDLEAHYSEPTGKYTEGLGLMEMGFCYDNEDINSIALTVTSNLMKDYNIAPNDIGYLAVGTETLVDKSKSVKTHLMELFGENRDIEGVDVKNACFGGTQALFGAVDWVKANYQYDGRMAIVVMADIAVYDSGPARCTGGAGAIAVLIGQNAPIILEDGLRSFFMENTWDFYKPIGGLATEFPIVDGKISLKCYLKAFDECCAKYNQKSRRILGRDPSVNDFSSIFFHCPFYKLVQKAFARIVFSDVMNNRISSENYASLEKFRNVNLPDTYEDKQFTSETIKASRSLLNQKVEPNMTLNRRVGNMYTPSLYAQLITFLSRMDDVKSLNDSRVLLFSYGSGLASAMFSMRFDTKSDDLTAKLRKMHLISKNAIERLDMRERHDPKEYEIIMGTRKTLVETDRKIDPVASKNGISDHLFPGTYYLQTIGEHRIRTYDKVQ
uniref:Hydroxymethylglutaryl-CoA synthase n=1 Tax=Panagrolaimus sp. JU765 TaxID=591449 RepID=A0AC34Q863_9BILA